jgi:hypothetical protein
MPIQLLSGRADAYLAALGAQGRPGPAQLPPASSPVDPGGIPGGLLRPGAIDQQRFKRYLADAQKQSVTAPPQPAGPAASGIPTLSPAQFAALGAVAEPASGAAAPAPSPVTATADPYPFLHQSRRAAVPGTESENEGAVPALPPASPADDPSAAATPAAPPGPAVDAPPAPAEASTKPAAAPTRQASATRGPIPGSHLGADGMWELPRLPDKDERDLLRGQKWRVVESPRARALFLGPDGKFGWDDFLDLVNPLQHIPFLNVAYRAVTGDQIYGAARMVDFAFGPLAGASTALDLALQSTTGQGLADNAIATLFGGDDAAGEVAGISTASGGLEQIADLSATRRGSNK